MPSPVLLIECVWCASPWLLALAARRELLELPVQYGICPKHEAEKDLDRFPVPE